MQGRDVYSVLNNKGVHFLHHANTVTTSCTFLRQKGLVSRSYAEIKGLPQTPQYSDATDKLYGIWNDIFTDGVDIHERARLRNQYGPVLFVLPIKILLSLPLKTEVMVMKKNPVNWVVGEPENERYFTDANELQQGYLYGDFGKHIVLRMPDGILPFERPPVRIVLDNPQGKLASGIDAFLSAERELQTSANSAPISIDISKRKCQQGCKCLSGHKTSYASCDLDSLF
jgi:hypothetical protein